MADQETLGAFFKENSKLAKEYLETKLEILRLRVIRVLAQSAGYFMWFIIALFLLFLFIIFGGIVLSLWFSELTGSYITGFGITTLVIAALIILLTLLRKTIFVNPVIRAFIAKTEDSSEETKEE